MKIVCTRIATVLGLVAAATYDAIYLMNTSRHTCLIRVVTMLCNIFYKYFGRDSFGTGHCLCRDIIETGVRQVCDLLRCVRKLVGYFARRSSRCISAVLCCWEISSFRVTKLEGNVVVRVAVLSYEGISS
jgi:hypothetical protein